MTEESFKNLQSLFADQPDLLRLIDPSAVSSAHLSDRLRHEDELFSSTVNLYATGRTFAGKTSLGNRLLKPGFRLLRSVGRMNCTDHVQFFELRSKLCYYDLPGVGSDGRLENINRAALGLPQLQGRRAPQATALPTYNYTDLARGEGAGAGAEPPEEVVSLEQWQRAGRAPDIILYVIAPHQLFFPADGDYLHDLLEAQRARGGREVVVFALNIHHEPGSGARLPTPGNIEDVRREVEGVYREVYGAQGRAPVVEVDCLSGRGVPELTEQICRMLPEEKLGRMPQLLKEELRQLAEREIRRRYAGTLVRVASRVALQRVDRGLGAGNLLEEVTRGLIWYGAVTFNAAAIQEEIDAMMQADIGSMVKSVEGSRTQKIEIKAPVVEERDIKVEKPVYETEEKEIKEIESKSMTVYVPSKKKFLWVFPRKEKKTIQVVGGTTTKKVKQVVLKEFKEEVVGTYSALVGEKVTGILTNYHEGGYDAIKLVLGVGLGVQAFSADPGDLQKFGKVITETFTAIEEKLKSYKTRINKAATSGRSNAQESEEEISKLLKEAFTDML